MKKQMKKIKIKIGDLFKKLKITEIDELVEYKGIFIKTPSGKLTEIKGFIKKSPKDIYKYNLSNNISVKCSDEHLFQENGVTKKAKECKFIDTINGKLKIISEEFIKKDYVYDISISNPHLYVTPNGIIHHNTSITNALIKDLAADVLWINGSQDRGIDTFRIRVRDFAISKGFDESKIVVIDEADGLTADGAQKLLRGLIEEVSENASFIFTANYAEKLIEPLRNRLIEFNFDEIFAKNKKEIAKQMYLRAAWILNNEGVKFDTKILQRIIVELYPSFRKIVLFLQKNVKNGELVVNENDINILGKFEKIMNLVKEKNFVEMKKMANDFSNISSIYSFVFKNIDRFFQDKSQPAVILLTAKYQDMNYFARDKTITAAAYLVELMSNTQIIFKD